MYEKNGEKYFIVDSHSHFWDASRENWKPGREEYAKGWIDCFYGYHQLAPPETHWDYEKYLKVTPEDFEQDMFVEGYVDKVVFQSTYLYDWYTEGFNTTEKNGELALKHPGKFIVNSRFEPRGGDQAMKEFEADVERCRAYAESSPSVVTPLNKHIGYEEASKVAKAALEEGRTIREQVLEMGYVARGDLTQDELDDALDVAAMTSPRA